VRVSVEHVFELLRHLTERDRELVLRLYGQQVLTTDQLTLLFFSSKRRAQDRLLFLYRQRVVDRFYPASRFGAGKPQAHWLLDEAGAFLVAAMLGVERKQLGWQRRDDWSSHPQLAHRLECNRFVTDLIAATLPDPALGVIAWFSSGDATQRLGVEGLVRPDAGFIFDTIRGPVDCYLEWDRGTETQETLMHKLDGYRLAEGKLHFDASRQACNMLFVVPGQGRIATLRRAYEQLEPKRERHRNDPYLVNLDGRWPLLAATASDLRRVGPLDPVWQSITDADEPRRRLTELPVRSDLGETDLGLALGRRWRHERPDFWERLSPLGRPLEATPEESALTEAAVGAAQPGDEEMPDPATATVSGDAADFDLAEALMARRRQVEEGARRDVAATGAGRRGDDLRPSASDGSMPDPEATEESWR
jgi:protein involved in plasmid replication-relaxation